NPTQSLAGDVEATGQIIDAQDGPVVLVGHSYGGAVITEAGNHPKVAALVYIAAFAPDKRGIGQHTHRRPAARRARTTHPAPAERVPLPRPGEVRGLLRRGPAGSAGRVHGRLAGSVGRRRAGRRGDRTRL